LIELTVEVRSNFKPSWTSPHPLSSIDGSALAPFSSSSPSASSSRKAGTSVRLPSFLKSPPFARASWALTIGETVAYALAIYLLNLFLAFLSPKFDPSNDAADNEMEDGSVGTLPTRQDEEFKPFIRRLPEFKFWYWATRAVVIGFLCSWFEIFNVPVFWPVLLMYWCMLFFLTSESLALRLIEIDAQRLTNSSPS
jgi:hypothetical protein